MTRIILSKKQSPIFEIENFYNVKIYDNKEFENAKEKLMQFKYSINEPYINKEHINLHKSADFIYLCGFLLNYLKDNDNFILNTNENKLYFKAYKILDNNYDLEFVKESNFVKQINLLPKLEAIKNIMLIHNEFLLKNYFFLLSYINSKKEVLGYYIEFDYNAFLKNKIKPVKKYIILPAEIIDKIKDNYFIYNNLKFEIIEYNDFKEKITNSFEINWQNSYLFLIDMHDYHFDVNIPYNLIFDFVDYYIILNLAIDINKRDNYFAKFIKDKIYKFLMFKKVFLKLLNKDKIANDKYMIVIKELKNNNIEIGADVFNIILTIDYILALGEVLDIKLGIKKIDKIIAINNFINFHSIIYDIVKKYGVLWNFYNNISDVLVSVINDIANLDNEDIENNIKKDTDLIA